MTSFDSPYQHGNPDSLVRLRAQLLVAAKRQLGHRQEALAEDLVQEVFAAVLCAKPEGLEQRHFPAYLLRSLHNRIASLWKRKAVRPEEVFDETVDHLPEVVNTHHGLPVIADLRRHLSASDEAVLFLRSEVHCSYETVAFVLDLTSPVAARRSHSRATQRLREVAQRLVDPA